MVFFWLEVRIIAAFLNKLEWESKLLIWLNILAGLVDVHLEKPFEATKVTKTLFEREKAVPEAHAYVSSHIACHMQVNNKCLTK